jgi:hypothetical protein
MTAAATAPAAARRPAPVTAAAALLALTGALGLLALPAGLGEAGAAILVLALVLAVLRLVAAAGVWQCRRWAAVLGAVATLLDTLLALPGLSAAPNAALGALATLGVALGVVTLVLLAVSAARRAFV